MQSAILKVKTATEKVEALTPDAATMRSVQLLQAFDSQTAATKTDWQVVHDKVVDKFTDGPDAIDGLEGVAKVVKGAVETASEVANVGKAFIDVTFTPSVVGGGAYDQLYPLSTADKEHMTDQLNQFAAARQDLQEAQQSLAQLMPQGSTKCSLESMSKMQQSGGPQLIQGQ